MFSAGVPTLTQRQLNRALLARQHLLDRADLTLPRVLESMAGLQAQYAPAMYIGLWSRVEGFRRDDLTTALEQRTVVQATLLRATIHLVSAEDYWPFTVAIRQARQEWYQRASRGRPSPDEMDEAAKQLRAALADGPLRRVEIDRLIGAERRAGVGMLLDLVRVPPSGTWERRRADLFGLAEDWLGPPRWGPAAGSGKISAADGVELLVRRYLTGFPPATRADIATWAGLPVSDITGALDRLPVRHFRSEDGAELVDLVDGALPAADTPAPVRFLPVWDAALLVHCRRSRILPEEYRPRIFNTKQPQSVNTFLVDGAVAGTWKYESGRITRQEFEPLPKSVRRQLDAEAERLADLHR